ncbi:Uncharacterised protein [uncultured archaeon]|nr:Uncharacterised protein [uncultured archaeon]
MQDTNYLKWCADKDKGIKLVAPSENLVRAYLEKSRTAIKSMELNANAGITEWAVSASYYARYFSVYAVMSKIGVKCEIHDCTIVLFAYLFGDSIPHHFIKEFKQSKDDRVDLQYYPKEVKINPEHLISQTKTFVLQIEEILDGLNSEKIEALRNKVKEAILR